MSLNIYFVQRNYDLEHASECDIPRYSTDCTHSYVCVASDASEARAMVSDCRGDESYDYITRQVATPDPWAFADITCIGTANEEAEEGIVNKA